VSKVTADSALQPEFIWPDGISLPLDSLHALEDIKRLISNDTSATVSLVSFFGLVILLR